MTLPRLSFRRFSPRWPGTAGGVEVSGTVLGRYLVATVTLTAGPVFRSRADWFGRVELVDVTLWRHQTGGLDVRVTVGPVEFRGMVGAPEVDGTRVRGAL